MPDTVADASQPEATIEIRLSRPQQLFNSLDPSPFHERDLDEDAEAYIVDSADEFAMKDRLKLVIHLPAGQLDPDAATTLPQAIHNYFTYRLEETRRRLELVWPDLPDVRLAAHRRVSSGASAGNISRDVLSAV